MDIDCLKCTNSACCKLVVEVNRKEYESLDYKKDFDTNTDVFINKNPKLSSKRKYFDEMYSDRFAELKKRDDGYCVHLDPKSMLCGVYEKRPQCCRDYINSLCEKIREICTN